jgi:glycogen operon protein
MLVTLLLSQGIPMVLAGDEMGRTQNGNNNAYCQDNALTWLDWDDRDDDLLSFTRRLIAFRARHHSFRRRTFFQGRPITETGATDLAWFTPAGTEMAEDEWHDPDARAVAMLLNGEAIELGRRGEERRDDTFLVLLNAHADVVLFTVPPAEWGKEWRTVIDTAAGTLDDDTDSERTAAIQADDSVAVDGQAILVLRRLD